MTLDPLRDTKTIALTTYKRDGSAVTTPVSVAFSGDRAFFRTWSTAWKARRLARDPRVRAAPCTLRGTPTGPETALEARLLGPEDSREAARALAARHRFLHRMLVPLAHRVMRYRTVHYELLPGER